MPKWPPKVFPRCQNGHPRYSRGAKIATQGASETPKWVLPSCQNGFPRCSRGAKIESRNVKTKAPSSPSGICREKKHGMLTWMLGCSRGAKMVAKIISRDASERKRPAAKGVALKIVQHWGSRASWLGSCAPRLCSIGVPAPHWWVPAPHACAMLSFPRRTGG